MKILDPRIADEICELEVIECDCGFHLGLDVSFLDQVKEIKMNCPACGIEIDTFALYQEALKNA